MTVLSQQQIDVLVLGAGPAGLACAYESASRGNRVCIVDRKSDPTRLHAGIAGVLHDISMPFDFTPDALPLGSDLSLNLRGRILKRVSQVVIVTGAGETVFRHNRPIQWYTDLAAICRHYWDRLDTSDSVQLLPGHSVQDVRTDRAGRIGPVIVRNGGSRMALNARDVVIADGIDSFALRKLGQQRRRLGTAFVLSQWLERPCGSDLTNDEVRVFCGAPYLKNPRALGLVIPFPDRVQFSTLTYLPPGSDAGGLPGEFRVFLRRVAGRTSSAIQPKLSGRPVALQPPLSRARIAENGIAVGDAAWAVEIYFRGAIESGRRLGHALAVADPSERERVLRDYDRWFSAFSRAHGSRELRAVLWLAELAQDGGPLPMLLARLAGHRFGPYPVAPSLLTACLLVGNLLHQPRAIARAIDAYRRLDRRVGAWADTPLVSLKGASS